MLSFKAFLSVFLISIKYIYTRQYLDLEQINADFEIEHFKTASFNNAFLSFFDQLF